MSLEEHLSMCCIVRVTRISCRSTKVNFTHCTDCLEYIVYMQHCIYYEGQHQKTTTDTNPGPSHFTRSRPLIQSPAYFLRVS